MIAFRQHGPIGIDTVKPPLKDSGRGMYPELWELDISTRSLMDRIHHGRERALLYVSRALGPEECSASCRSLSEDRMRGGGVTLSISFFKVFNFCCDRLPCAVISEGGAPRNSGFRRGSRSAPHISAIHRFVDRTDPDPVGE